MRFRLPSANVVPPQWAMAVIVFVAVCFAGPSWAGDKSAAIMRPSGDGGADLQDQVITVLEKDFGYKVVSSRQVAAAMDDLGMEDDESSDRPLQKLGNEVNAAVVIRIQASRIDGGAHKADITLIFADKRKTRSFTIFYGARASGTSIDRKLRDTLDVVLLGKSAKNSDDDDDVRPRGKNTDDDDENASEEDDDEDRPKKKKKKKKKVEDEDDEMSETELYDMLHSANRAALRVDIGPSMIARNLSFNSNPIDNKPPGYSNSPVPGARIAAEFYPFALKNRLGAAAGLGIGLDYDRTLSLSVRLPTADGMVISLPTSQSRLFADLRYRFVFGNRATSPSLTVIAGYGTRDFTVDRIPLSATNMILDMPDVSYQMFAPGLVGRFPVAPAVALGVQARGLLVFDAGAIQTRQEYGQATVTGVDSSLSVDVLLGKRFALKAALDFAIIGYSFTGNGEKAVGRDGDATTKDVGGASDRYIGGSLTMAVLF